MAGFLLRVALEQLRRLRAADLVLLLHRTAVVARTLWLLLVLRSVLSTAAVLVADIPTFQPTELEGARCSVVVEAGAARARRLPRLLSTRRLAVLRLSQAVAVVQPALLERPLLRERLVRTAGCTEAVTVAAAAVERSRRIPTVRQAVTADSLRVVLAEAGLDLTLALVAQVASVGMARCT